MPSPLNHVPTTANPQGRPTWDSWETRIREQNRKFDQLLRDKGCRYDQN
jgi:hypothetical protein